MNYLQIGRPAGGRNASVELLRCILMFLIVFHHAAYWGIWKGDVSQRALIFIGSVAVMFHVDAFVAISGWFGIKFSWKKFFALWLQVMFYAFVSFLWAGWKNHWSLNKDMLIIHGGWFVPAYFLLMLIAPLLNGGIEYLSQKGKKEMLSALKALAIGIVLMVYPVCLITGVGRGPMEAYSVSTLVFVYVVTQIVKRMGFWIRPKMFWLIILSYLTIVGLLYAGLSLSLNAHMIYSKVPFIAAYNMPWVWFTGIIIVVYFVQNVHIGGCVAKVASFCAPSMFGIYLLHHTTAFGDRLFTIPERFLFERTGIPSLGIVFMSALFCFFMCLICDLVRRCLFWVGLRTWSWVNSKRSTM